VDGRPTRAGGESDLLERASRAAVERTSVFVRTHRPSRAGAGPETSRCSAREGRHRVRTSPVRRVPPFGRTCARHGGARSGASGGLQSRNRRGTSSRFGRSARDALFGERRESGSSLRESRKGSAPANAPRGETSPRERTSDHDPRLVARAS